MVSYVQYSSISGSEGIHSNVTLSPLKYSVSNLTAVTDGTMQRIRIKLLEKLTYKSWIGEIGIRK